MDEEMKEILAAVLETEVDEEATIEEVFKELSPRSMGSIKGMLRILNAYKEDLPDDIMAKLAKLAGFKMPKKEPAKKEEKKDVKKEEKKEEEKKDVKKDEPKDVEPVIKALEARLDAAEKRADDSDKALNDERDLRQTNEWLAKSETELSHFPGKSAEELGKMLKELHDKDPEMAKTQFDAMKTVSDEVRKSANLREISIHGGNGKDGATDSAWSKIEKMADGLVEKSSDIEFTRAKAINQVLKSEEGKRLYNQYLAEHPAQTQAVQ